MSATAAVEGQVEKAAPAAGRWVLPSLLAVYVIWGSTYWVMRVAVEHLPPFFMAAWRYLVTGSVLLLLQRWRGAPWPTRREWLFALPVGVLMFAGGNGTVAWAEKHISSGAAAVICGTMPLWAAAFGPLFGERATRREWLALVLGFGGVATLGLSRELRAEPAAAAAVMFAPVAWALGSLLSRRWPLAKGLMSAATQMVTGGLVMAALSLGAREPWPNVLALPTRALAAWVYLGLFGSLVAYSAYTYLLRNTRPAVATSYSYVNPAIAVAVGAGFGNEPVTPETLVAVALIIGATVLVLRGRAR